MLLQECRKVTLSQIFSLFVSAVCDVVHFSAKNSNSDFNTQEAVRNGMRPDDSFVLVKLRALTMKICTERRTWAQWGQAQSPMHHPPPPCFKFSSKCSVLGLPLIVVIHCADAWHCNVCCSRVAAQSKQ